MNLVDYYAGKLGKSVSEIMDAAAFMVGPDGPVAFRWDEALLGPRPNPADLDKIEALPDPAPDLAGLKAVLKASVDAAAESLRLKLITPGAGQAMEYQEAYAQARAALAAEQAEASEYPMLAATIGVDFDPQTGKPAADVLGVARSVKAAYEAFLTAGAAIRGARLLAKAEIDAASDADHARAVFSAISWPALG